MKKRVNISISEKALARAAILEELMEAGSFSALLETLIREEHARRVVALPDILHDARVNPGSARDSNHKVVRELEQVVKKYPRKNHKKPRS